MSIIQQLGRVRGVGGVNVRDYGARGDGSTDDRAAILAARDAVWSQGGGVLYFPRGRYRVSDELDFYRPNSPRVDVALVGDDEFGSVIDANFFGASKSLIKVHDSTWTTRASPFSLRDIGLSNVTTTGGVNPVLLNVGGWGESELRGVRFGGSNNTVLRAGSAQNLTGYRITSFGAGKSWNYKDATGITFSISSGTITASASIFTDSAPNDVGRILNIIPTSGNRRKYRITAVASATEATVVSVVTDGTVSDTTGATGFFDHAVVNMNSGSNVVTSTTATFTDADVGRAVYIRNARSGIDGGRALLRGLIGAYTSPTQVSLIDEQGDPVNADFTIGSTPIYTPAVEFYSPVAAGTLGAGGSDQKLFDLQIESYAGAGLVLSNTDSTHIYASKIHGRTSITNAIASTTALVVDNASFEYTGSFDTSCAIGRNERVFICNQNKSCIIGPIENRNAQDERFMLVQEFADPGGMVTVKDVDFLGPMPSGFGGVVEDGNTPGRVVRFGTWTRANQGEPRTYGGERLYVAREVSLGTVGNVRILVGEGTPEGAVEASPGSLFLRVDGSTSTTLYVKTSGTGNTGWTAK